MSLCRRLQKLPCSDGVRLLWFQAFHKSALRGQEHDLVPSEEVRHGRQSTLPGKSWPGTTEKTDLLPSEVVRQCRPSTLPGKAGPGTMSRNLVKTVMGLSDVKEEVYGALDEWAAFELEFPVVATRKALERLRNLEQWHRVIQVTKWMLSKGIGKTHGTYGLLLKAYCKEGRMEEAEEFWDKIVASHTRSMPKNLFAFMTNAYRSRGMPEKVIQVFEQMESFGIKPDKDLLRRAGEAYQQLNMQEKAELLGKKYPLNSRTRRNEKRFLERKALKASKPGKRDVRPKDTKYQTDDGEDSDQEQIAIAQTDDDEDSDQEQVATVQQEQTREACSKGRTYNRSEDSRRVKKSGSAPAGEDEFVKQIIDTM
eukprot:c6525_g1_i1 orf=218-1318(+)